MGLEAHRHCGLHPATWTIDPTINVLGIYHNWPGFFATSALLTTLAGRDNLLTIASWAPFVFNVMNLVVLRFVLSLLRISAWSS